MTPITADAIARLVITRQTAQRRIWLARVEVIRRQLEQMRAQVPA